MHAHLNTSLMCADNDEEVESSENSSSSGDVASSEVSSTDAYDSNPTDVLEDINDSFASALALDAPRPPWWSLLPPSGNPTCIRLE